MTSSDTTPRPVTRRAPAAAGLLIVLALTMSGCGTAPQDPREGQAQPPVAPSVHPTGGTSGGTTQEEQGAGSIFATPGPDGATPVLRYAYCLRQKGLPAVVVGENVAYESEGAAGSQNASVDTAAAEQECLAANTDYQPPNLNEK